MKLAVSLKHSSCFCFLDAGITCIQTICGIHCIYSNTTYTVGFLVDVQDSLNWDTLCFLASCLELVSQLSIIREVSVPCAYELRTKINSGGSEQGSSTDNGMVSWIAYKLFCTYLCLCAEVFCVRNVSRASNCSRKYNSEIRGNMMRKNIFLFLSFCEFVSFNTVLDYL